MDDDKKLKLLETVTAVIIGLLSKTVVKLASRDPADKFLIKIILLHISILIMIILASFLITKTF